MKSAIIRPICSEDFESVCAVLSETWNASYAHLLGAQRAAELLPSQQLLGRAIDVAIVAPEPHFDVAELDRRVIAFSYSEPGLCFGRFYLSMLYVSPDFQGQGIGSRMLNLVCDPARGARSMRLQVLEGNSGAQAFYEKKGFRTIRNGWHFATRQRIIVMEQKLQPSSNLTSNGVWG